MVASGVFQSHFEGTVTSVGLVDLERLRVDGFVVVPDALSATIIEWARQRIERLNESIGDDGTRRSAAEWLWTTVTGEEPFGRHSRIVPNLLAYGSVFQEFVLHPDILALAESLLDPDLLLSHIDAIIIQPAERAGHLHADDSHVPVSRPQPPFGCTILWPLVDFTEQNGATRVIPGSHTADEPMNDPASSIAIETKRGSCIVLDSRLLHHCGANRSQRARPAVQVYFQAGYLRPFENQLLSIPRATQIAFPPRLQELIGFRAYRGHVGCIERRDPMAVLSGEETRASSPPTDV